MQDTTLSHITKKKKTMEQQQQMFLTLGGLQVGKGKQRLLKILVTVHIFNIVRSKVFILLLFF